MQQLPDNNEDINNQKPERVFSSYVINFFIVYTITNLENNWYYIGHSSSGEEWKNSHASRLERGIFPIKDLQDDYNGIIERGLDVNEYLVFNVIQHRHIFGNNYSLKDVEEIKRQFFDIEQNMIFEAFSRGDNLYNTKPVMFAPRPTASGTLRRARTARGVKYKGKEYQSISALRREKGFHYDAINRKCNDPNDNDFVWMTEEENTEFELNNTSIPVSVFGNEFPSLQAAQIYLQGIGTRTSIRWIKQFCDDPTNNDYKYL